VKPSNHSFQLPTNRLRTASDCPRSHTPPYPHAQLVGTGGRLVGPAPPNAGIAFKIAQGRCNA
jgi:hypothetical protein